jgi:hypothetical protein
MPAKAFTAKIGNPTISLWTYKAMTIHYTRKREEQVKEEQLDHTLWYTKYINSRRTNVKWHAQPDPEPEPTPEPEPEPTPEPTPPA